MCLSAVHLVTGVNCYTYRLNNQFPYQDRNQNLWAANHELLKHWLNQIRWDDSLAYELYLRFNKEWCYHIVGYEKKWVQPNLPYLL